MGNVYFIQAADRVKIGFAADVPARLAQLQTGNPIELRLLAVIQSVEMSAERRLHRAFADSRVQGEWFRLTGPLAALIGHIRDGVRPTTEADISHYSHLGLKFGWLCSEARRAIKSDGWAGFREEYVALGGNHAKAVEVTERRYLQKKTR